MSSMGESIHMHLSWTELPSELLEFISSKISDIFDFARFRCVCRSWRSAAIPSNLSPQLPWLMLPYDPYTEDRPFYSFSTRSTRTLHLPEARDHIITAFSNGWLLLVDRSLNFNFLNPLTRAQVNLPPISTFPYDRYFHFAKVGNDFVCRASGYATNNEVIGLKFISTLLRCCAFVSPDFQSQFAGIVVLNFSCGSRFLYWRSADETWTLLDSGLEGLIDAFTFHRGHFYAIDFDEAVYICDLVPNSKGRVIPLLLSQPQTRFYKHLVSVGEDLLLIDDANIFVMRNKLDGTTGGIMSWLKLEKLGDYSIFVTKHRFTSVVSNAYGYARNCLYVIDHCREVHEDGKVIPQIHMITVRDGHTKDVCCLWKSSDSNSHLETALLFVPSLH